MDRDARGEKGEEGRERRNRCKKIVDAKMRFAKTRPVFPCAAHANSFTRVPGRNAAAGLLTVRCTARVPKNGTYVPLLRIVPQR
jgi:hypothetical protein